MATDFHVFPYQGRQVVCRIKGAGFSAEPPAVQIVDPSLTVELDGYEVLSIPSPTDVSLITLEDFVSGS